MSLTEQEKQEILEVVKKEIENKFEYWEDEKDTNEESESVKLNSEFDDLKDKLNHIERKVGKAEENEPKIIITIISVFGIFASLVVFIVSVIVKSSQLQQNWWIMLLGSTVSLVISLILFITCIAKSNKKKRKLRKFWKFLTNIFYVDKD